MKKELPVFCNNSVIIVVFPLILTEMNLCDKTVINKFMKIGFIWIVSQKTNFYLTLLILAKLMMIAKLS